MPIVKWSSAIREGEGRALLLCALAFFCILSAYYIIRPVRDQLSGATGSVALPLFYTGTFLATLAITPLFGALVARVSRHTLLIASYSFFIVCLILFVPAFMAQGRIGARTLGVVFFIWVSVFNLFVVSLFWSFMADIWNSVQARRLFPIIALGGTAGALAGPALTSALVYVLGVPPLLLISACLLGLALWALLYLSARTDANHATHGQGVPTGGSLLAGARQVLTQPFLRTMALLMLLSDGIGTLAYALVADYAKAHFSSSADRVAFYTHIDLAVNVLMALLQISVTRWVLMRLGAVWGLVLPSLLNVGLLLALALFSGLSIRVAGMGVSLLVVVQVANRALTYGMSKPATDALYTRSAREARYKGKNFVETAVWRFGDVVVTSGVDVLHVLGFGVSLMALVASGFSGLAAGLGWHVKHLPDLAPEREFEGNAAASDGPGRGRRNP